MLVSFCEITCPCRIPHIQIADHCHFHLFQAIRHNNLKFYLIQGLALLGYHHPSVQAALARIVKDIKLMSPQHPSALDRFTNYPMDKDNVLMLKYIWIPLGLPGIMLPINNSALQPVYQGLIASLIVSSSVLSQK
jgi:hypothetical protein